MSDPNDMSSFASSMMEMFRRLGLPDPLLVGKIKESWDDVAPNPWKGRSSPVTVQGKTLIVEANSPSMVAFLRYSSADLVKALTDRFGEGVVDSVEVRSP